MQSPLKLLTDAFADARHPGNDRLLRADVDDDSDVSFLYGSQGRAWYDLDPGVLDREGSCITALSDEGLRYVLPAYVLMFVQGHLDSNGWIDRLLKALSTNGGGRLNLNSSQFELIDRLLLSKVEAIGSEFGAAGSTFGVGYSNLVQSIRRSQEWVSKKGKE